jgi:TonB family protein
MTVHTPSPLTTAAPIRATSISALLRSLCMLCVLCGSSVAVASAQEVKQAGTEVNPPKRTRFVAPTYPPEAQASGQRGIVILELVVDTEGKVESVTVVRSVPPFDEAATVAVKQWEYEVTRVNGSPVKVRLTVPITFALKLPTLNRAPGIPEMRMGAAPGLPPEPWNRNEATVEADVTLDPDGHVTDALITAGDSPWAEALLQAVRTWRFVGSSGEGPLTFKATAHFVSGAPGKVDLKLSDPRRTLPPLADAGAAATPPTAPAAPPDPAAPPGAAPPAAAPAGTTAPPVEAPSATTPATAPAEPSPAAPPPTTPPADAPPTTLTPSTPPVTERSTPTAKPAAPAAGGSVQAPPVEVVPAAPAPPPPPPQPEGGGGSAVRGILLGTGVPDLVSGRRPVVPPLARLNTVAGKVLVRFAVDASGATSNAQAEGPEALREAARQAVSSWIFRRTKADRIHLTAEFDYAAETATATVNLAPER